MTSSDGAEAKPNTAMSTADLEVDSRDGTRSPPVVSPANSAPVSPSPGKPTISASHELNAEELVKSIEDIQSEFSNDVKRKLPDHFEPTPSSVICGRGKECFESEGVSITSRWLSKMIVLAVHGWTYLTLSSSL